MVRGRAFLVPCVSFATCYLLAGRLPHSVFEKTASLRIVIAPLAALSASGSPWDLWDYGAQVHTVPRGVQWQ